MTHAPSTPGATAAGGDRVDPFQLELIRSCFDTIADDMDNFEDWPYYVDFVKASVATFAHMNSSLIPSGLGTLEGTVGDAAGKGPIEGATVTMDDGQGHF